VERHTTPSPTCQPNARRVAALNFPATRFVLQIAIMSPHDAVGFRSKKKYIYLSWKQA